MEPRPVILVSDDEPFIISAMRRLARTQGLEVVGDTQGERIQTLAREVHPRVIVLDVHQPDDGRDILARLKRDPDTRDIPVVMLSAVEDQYTRLTCLQLGALDYAVKPLDVSFVAKLARMASPGSRSTSGPRARSPETRP